MAVQNRLLPETLSAELQTMHLIFDHDEVLAAWAAQRIPNMGRGFSSGSRAIGVMDDILQAVVIYHDYFPEFGTCQVSIAAASPRWAQRGIIRALLSVPFEQYGVRKLGSMIASNNPRALRFNKGIGFKQEATLRHQFGHKIHGIVTSMMADEFQRIYGSQKVMSAETSPNLSRKTGVEFFSKDLPAHAANA